MSDNWIVSNLENALADWNGKLAEMWALLTQSPETFKGGTIWSLILSVHNALVSRALESQEQKKRMVAFAAAASEFAKKIDKSDYTKMEYVTSYGYYEKKKTVERPADADTVHYYYTENEYNVTIYREKASEDGEDDAAARAEMEKKTAERKRRVMS